MSYEAFLEYIRQNIGKYMDQRERNKHHTDSEAAESGAAESSDCYEVELKKVTKNNGIVLDGLTIRRKGESVSPSIYLNGYYGSYQMGKPVNRIMEEILEHYDEIKQEGQKKIDSLADFSAVRDKIVLRLVNYEKNKEQLRNCPYKKYLDLAITFRYLAGKEAMGIASSLITNQEYECWNVGMDELYDIALFNTMQAFPWQMDSLAKIIADSVSLNMPEKKELLEDMEMADKSAGSLKMYVLTNDVCMNGATCMLYDNVIRNFARVQEVNVFLLPSSIHEIMLVVEDEHSDPEFLQELVRDANESAVGLIDWLSDNIYYYDREKNEISIYDHAVSA